MTSIDELAEVFGLDEFQKIAIASISADLDGFQWPPEPGLEHERKLIELGAIVAAKPW